MSPLESRRRRIKPRSVTDWEAAKRILAAAAAEGGGRHSDAQQIELELQQRAAALSNGGKLEQKQAAAIELLCFAIGGQRCALETGFIVEVRRRCELTRLPGTPAHLLGVMNLRGEITPVFDLGDRLGMGRSGAGEQSRLLVLGEAEAQFGVQVDAVFEIVKMPAGEVLERAGVGHAAAPELVAGVTREALVVLNAAALLADPQLQIGEADDADTREGAAP